MVDAACDNRLHGRNQARPVGEPRPSLEDHHTDDQGEPSAPIGRVAMAASTTTISKRRAEQEPAIKLRKGNPDAQFMDPSPKAARLMPLVPAGIEAPQLSSNVTTTRSIAVVVSAPASALHAVPPAEFDDQIEETIDYSPLATIAALDHPAEEWPEGSGPFGC
jgi:hypothetical protein